MLAARSHNHLAEGERGGGQPGILAIAIGIAIAIERLLWISTSKGGKEPTGKGEPLGTDFS